MSNGMSAVDNGRIVYGVFLFKYHNYCELSFRVPFEGSMMKYTPSDELNVFFNHSR
jgi:hypothetical protein